MSRYILMATLAVSAWTSNAYALSCIPDRSDYQIKDGKVVFIFSSGDERGEQRVATEVDPHSMKSVVDPFKGTGPCSERVTDYVRDKSRVYYKGKPITGADPDAFEFINRYFAKDGTAVYGLDQRITTRVADFRILGDSRSATYGVYATDGQRYFYKDTILAGEGFEFVPKTYEVVRTSTAVYSRGKVLDVDVKSFEGLIPSVSMTRDKNHVYYHFAAIPGADPATIEQIKGHLWKDKRAVYQQGREIVGLDPATARTFPLDSRFTADDRFVFRMHQKIDRDPATFTVLQYPYSKDKNGVYYNDEKIGAADPDSFVTPSMSSGADKNYRFYRDTIVCKIKAEAPTSDRLCTP
jgi:hypothetical protein